MIDLKKRAFRKMFKGKTKVHYKLKVMGEDYEIEIFPEWEWKFFEKFTKTMGEKTGEKLTVPEEFEATERTHQFILNTIEPMIKDIQKMESKKLHGFKILKAEIKNAKFKREGERIKMFLTIRGLCQYEL